MNLRAWIKRTPEAHSVRCSSSDGEVQVVVIAPRSHTKYADAERAILALNPERVEALDGGGSIIRVVDLRAEGEEDEPLAAPKSSRADEFAALMTIACTAADKAAQRHAEAYRVAFEQMAAITKSVSDRAFATEKILARLLKQAEERAEEAREEPQGDPATASMIQLATQALASGALSKAPPNGGDKK
jgi:hypothetical protein